MSMSKRIGTSLLFALALVASAGVRSASASAAESELVAGEEAGGGTCRIWCVTHNVHELIAC